MTIRTNEKLQAFERQALGHADALYRYSMRMTRNPDDADDLVQETYLKAYRFWETYDQGTNLRAWLYRILKNSYITIYRKELRAPEMLEYNELVGSTSGSALAAIADSQQDPMFNNLLDDDVSSAVSDLPEDFRTVVILSDIEGLTYVEIARFLNRPLGTVRSRLHRGRKILHSRLEEYARERGYMRMTG